MAELTLEQRRALWAAYMRQNTDPITITKPDLRAAVDAIDAWFDANAATLNQALPQPARAELTVKQKALLLKMVLDARYVVEGA